MGDGDGVTVGEGDIVGEGEGVTPGDGDILGDGVGVGTLFCAATASLLANSSVNQMRFCTSTFNPS